jgi:PAS domain S-box-containing protein
MRLACWQKEAPVNRVTRNKLAKAIAIVTWTACPVLLVIGYLDARADRKQLEGELAVRNAVDAAVHELRESADHGHVVLDLDGRVIEWNPALAAWTGWTKAEMLGNTLERVMAPAAWADHRAGYIKFMADPKNAGKSFKLVCRLQHRDPSKKSTLVQINARAVHPEGQPPMAIAFIDRERLVVDGTKGEMP